MKVQLDHKIVVVINEGDKVKEKLTVFFREFTRSEKKEQEALTNQFKGISKKAQKLSRKQLSLGTKARLLELDGEYREAIKTVEDSEKIEDELEVLLEELTELGGGDIEYFNERTAERRFNTLVSGKDKDALLGYAEIKGFSTIMSLLDNEKRELEKKQSGE
jgi:hypothetical protein